MGRAVLRNTSLGTSQTLHAISLDKSHSVLFCFPVCECLAAWDLCGRARGRKERNQGHGFCNDGRTFVLTLPSYCWAACLPQLSSLEPLALCPGPLGVPEVPFPHLESCPSPHASACSLSFKNASHFLFCWWSSSCSLSFLILCRTQREGPLTGREDCPDPGLTTLWLLCDLPWVISPPWASISSCVKINWDHAESQNSHKTVHSWVCRCLIWPILCFSIFNALLTFKNWVIWYKNWNCQFLLKNWKMWPNWAHLPSWQ